MKMLNTLVVIVLVLAGCGRLLNTDSVKDFVPGSYVSSWKTAYSRSRDTIQIELSSSQGSKTFLITRRTLTEYTGNEKKRAASCKTARWTGVYVRKSGTVTILNNGRILSFDPSGKSMTMGVTVYKKL